MRVALIQDDEHPDGSALALARLLRARGHDVTCLVPQVETMPLVPNFVNRWTVEGFAWLPVSSGRLIPKEANFPRERSLAAARSLSKVVEAFDVAWFFQRYWAMPALRDRRFRDRLLPLIVLDQELQPESLPQSVEEINRATSSQYALKWADLTCNGNACIPAVEILWNERCKSLPRPVRPSLTSPAVTICIPYFEAPEFLLETLQSLERQTSDDFTVVVVDDGSHTQAARQAFDTCSALYASRKWTFLRQGNKFPGAARNRAAQEANSEFLLFLDADDVAMPDMVKVFLRAALLTGDDCLVVPNYGFREGPDGRCDLLYDPPGSLISSMGDDMHGGSCIFVRREAFGRVGGFTEIRGVGYEDYEFHVRCHLQGLRWDILPELIYRYRLPRAGGVSLSTAQYANQSRVLLAYEEHLQNSRLRQLPLAFASTFWRLERANQTIGRFEKQLAPLLAVRPSRPAELKLLLLTCYFPYGMRSGWHIRAQEMIRYFGSRYKLTLVAPMLREQFTPLKKEALRYLEAVRGVEGSYQAVAGSQYLPIRVRQQYTETFYAALQALPTCLYHATIIDQIFMAEFRRVIDSPVILTEQNIESRLLRQASELTLEQPLPLEYQNAGAEAARLEAYENATWPDFPLRAVVSDADREVMDRRTDRGKTVVAPNGANLSTWLSAAKRTNVTVLFPAQLNYLANVDAVNFLLAQIWPRVLNGLPDATLILAGRDPAEAVKVAATKARRVKLVPNPESMDKVARGASMTVVPLRLGSGTRCKILESMAWGLPVVSTTLGSEGIEAVDGEHILLRDHPDDFADAICELLRNESLWQKLRSSGRQLVRERYCWDRVFEPLEDALIELVS